MADAQPLLSRTRGRAASAWSRSLVLRTVLMTLALAIVVVALVAVALLNRVSTGLLDAKQTRSLTDATADWEQSLSILAAADAGPSTASPERIVDGVLADLARNAGSPAAYEILLLQPPQALITGPERATNLISPASVPQRLRDAVATEGSQQWTNAAATYLDGSDESAMVVGAPVDVPGVGSYQLFHVFPYSEEQQIITLVRSAALVAGGLLVALLAAIVWLVTRQVAVPIRQAARAAVQIAEGDLDRRIPVERSDETAQLATSFNAMADSLQHQINELEDLSRVQQRFVSDVSHELRTPLTTIRMASDVLYERRHVVDRDTGRAIELLATQVDRFESLLSDLLEISRIDANAAELDLEEFDLSALVGSILSAAEPLAAERSSRVSCTMPLGLTVVADPRRIARIIRNLVSNALEYGSGSPTDVLVATDGSAAAVGVRDHGPGLDAEQQRRVFDRFWRADPARTRTLGGSGLGLSISLEDALLHRGALECVSQPGQGTLFVLTIGAGEDDMAPLTRPVPVDLAAFDAAMHPRVGRAGAQR
jgi:two-component system sensor histidine kinase MtrB